MTIPSEVEQLRAKVEALEQLLEVYEQETIEKSSRLEQTLAELHHQMQRLTHAESTLSTLRSMLTSMGDGVVVVDQQGDFLFLNPSAEHLLGISTTCSTLAGWAQHWEVYLPDQTTLMPLHTFPLVEAMQGKTPEPIEIFVRTGDLTAGHWLSVMARSLCDQSGDIRGGIAVFHNITRLKQVEFALRQSETHSREQTEQLQQALDDLQRVQTQLVQTEKMSSLGQLVAGIAHEINNPVNFIHGNLSYLQDYSYSLLEFISLVQTHYPNPVKAVQLKANAIDLDFLLEDLPKMLDSMRIGTERIRQIVLSLRNFSRTDEAEIKSVNIHDGIESTLLILQHRLKPKADSPGIQIHRAYSDLPLVACYPGQLNQVFMNILANAIDALEASSQLNDNQTTDSKTQNLEPNPQNLPAITITTQLLDSNWVQIAIADNGTGITDELQQRIFDPFFTTKPIGKGTGMGLSISYQIITVRHNGHLKCSSEPGQGTEFLIQIPIQQPQAS